LKPDVQVATAPDSESAADRIRRLAAGQLVLHDQAVASAGIRSGDPIEPVLAASRNLIKWTAEIADSMALAARPLSPEAERHLAERVALIAGAAVRAEIRNFRRGARPWAWPLAGCALVVLLLASSAAGYGFGLRGSVVSVQLKSGEVLGSCQRASIQSAPDGRGRICAVWVRLDQTEPRMGGER
jgi:hypothetical protein